jgi:FtsH-binding integral membrane protein
VYGYWAAAVNRDDVPGAGATAGSITGWNLLFGFVTAFVFMALYSTVRAVAPRLRREQRALLWSAFTGIAFGFLYSQAEVSVERSAVMALLVAAPVFAVSFYRYSTHGDAEGHRLR